MIGVSGTMGSMVDEQITLNALKKAVWLLRNEPEPPNTLRLCWGALYALRADRALLFESVDIGPRAKLLGLDVWIVEDRFPGDRYFEVIYVGKRKDGLW